MNVCNIFLYVHICLLGYIIWNPWESSELVAEQESHDSTNKDSQSESELQLIAIDIKNKFSSDEFEYSYNSSDDSHTFVPNPGFVIDRVTKGNLILWDAKDYGFECSTKLFVGFNDYGERVFRVYFPGSVPLPTQPFVKLSYPSPAAGRELPTRSPTKGLFLPKSQSDDERDYNKYLIAVNLKYQSSTENITYERDNENDLHIFTANEPYRFVLVMSGARSIWRYKYGAIPNRATVLKDTYGGSHLRLEFFTPTEISRPEAKSDFEAPKSVEEETEEESEVDEEPEEVVEKPKFIDPAKFKELDNRRKIDLDIKKRESTHEYWYSNGGRTHVFSSNNNYLFDTVKIADFKVWAARDKSDYANKVEYNNYEIFGMKDIVITLFVGGMKKFIKYKNEPWTEIDLTKFNLVTINIKSVFNTYAYSNKCDGRSRTFTAKHGFLFDRIIKWSSPRTTVQTIWQARDSREYAKRVIIDGVQPYQSTNNVIIHFPNKKKKHLVRINKSWVQRNY